MGREDAGRLAAVVSTVTQLTEPPAPQSSSHSHGDETAPPAGVGGVGRCDGAVGVLDCALGSTVSYDGYRGPVLVSADGRTVTVGGFSLPCFGSLALTADETPTQVALRLRTTTPRRHGVCHSAMGMVQALVVHLRVPLGSRALVDGGTGLSLPWFDGRKVLRPATLPAGYRPEVTSAWVTSGRSTGPRFPLGCVQYFRSARTGGVFEIAQTMGIVKNSAVASKGSRTVWVRGVRGLAGDNSVGWVADGQTFTVIIVVAPGEGPGPVLTIDDLIATVDSAP